MAGIRDKPANLRRGIAPIRGGIVDELNELSRVVARLDPNSGIQSGLGTRLARELNRPISILNARVEAQTGRRGPVVIAKQTKKPIERKFQVAADFNDQPITGIGFPEKGSDAINLDYFRRFLNCDWFEKMFDDCIEEEDLRAARPTGEGVIPWFFGYLIHPPNELDTHTNDMETFGRIYMWPFVLTHPAVVNKVTFGILDHFFAITDPTINVGLADTDLQLVLETGPVSISDPAGPPGQQLGGYYQTTLPAEVSLDAGEYYMCFSSNACIDIWSFSANSTPIFEFLNTTKLRFLNCIISTGHQAMPTDFTLETLESLILYNSVNIPIILYEQ